LFNSTGSLGSLTAASIRSANARIASLKPEDFPLGVDDIDWNVLAGKYVRSRSAIDCKIQWMGNDDARINHEPWTRAEDKRLLKLAEEHQAHDWIEIARKLEVSARGFDD
jgi:hypothetical protein